MSNKIFKPVSKYEAYPFLHEDSLMCDYEILTDRYASAMSNIYGLLKDEDKPNVKMICELVYHANPCIRNKCEITDSDLNTLVEIMNGYDKYMPKYFVLPLDTNPVSGAAEVLRAEAKQIVRLIYRIEREEGIDVDVKVYDVFNITSEIMFGIAMKYAEIPERFISRTYK